MDASGNIKAIETEKRASFVTDVRRQSFYGFQRDKKTKLVDKFKQSNLVLSKNLGKGKCGASESHLSAPSNAQHKLLRVLVC